MVQIHPRALENFISMPQTITDNSVIGEVLHEWTVPEYEEHDRTMRWYIVMSAIGLALVVYGIMSQNFIFSLIIILAAIILFLQSKQKPASVLFRVTELGVALNNRFYTYSELKGFYIIYRPGEVKTLFLDTASNLRPMIRIHLKDVNPVDVQSTLRAYLPEDVEKEEEPASDIIARQWKIH